eukprot:Hpha_TRINITY_DN16687_c2_g7::TRINITY_DN16687_c2_g7_i1::g.182713::m.182713
MKREGGKGVGEERNTQSQQGRRRLQPRPGKTQTAKSPNKLPDMQTRSPLYTDPRQVHFIRCLFGLSSLDADRIRGAKEGEKEANLQPGWWLPHATRGCQRPDDEPHSPGAPLDHLRLLALTHDARRIDKRRGIETQKTRQNEVVRQRPTRGPRTPLHPVWKWEKDVAVSQGRDPDELVARAGVLRIRRTPQPESVDVGTTAATVGRLNAPVASPEKQQASGPAAALLLLRQRRVAARQAATTKATASRRSPAASTSPGRVILPVDPVPLDLGEDEASLLEQLKQRKEDIAAKHAHSRAGRDHRGVVEYDLWLRAKHTVV